MVCTTRPFVLEASGVRVRDGSGNPTLFSVDCSAQPDRVFVPRNDLNEGHAQKIQKNHQEMS